LKDGLAIYDAFRAIVPVVLSITAEDTDGARALLASVSALSSRDALHLAVMRRAGIRQIVSFDKGFDHVRGVRRIQPR
jgi:predicted nucleic acid-binding protein